MSVYYNSVGEGWFKKKDNVVNEAKYTANDLACTDNLKLMKYEGHRNILEIDLDTMDWDSKEVTEFLLKYLKGKNADFYACQDIIDTTIQGAKRDGSDTVYIAFESKNNIVNEENNNLKNDVKLNIDYNHNILEFYISALNKIKEKVNKNEIEENKLKILNDTINEQYDKIKEFVSQLKKFK